MYCEDTLLYHIIYRHIGIYNVKQLLPTVKRGFVIPAYLNDQYGVNVRSETRSGCLGQRGEADIYG